MNARCFRLVFSPKLGMFVPAHEGTRARGKGGARAAGAGLALAALLTAAPATAQLPVPCAGGACGANPNPTAFVTSGAASYAVQGVHGVIHQTSQQAILNWHSFNIGAGHSVQFQHPNAQAATLNRIWDANPSSIAGALRANGHVYLINQNGIVFHNGAQVNVGALTASSLNLSDARFLDGIVADKTRAAVFEGSTGFVRVEAGARLTAASGGRILLLAPRVENAGVIETPDGQTILAAGQRVYLNDARDPSLLVEVDAGGEAVNLGQIIAQRGNVSLVGLAVNQQGRITATTSVRSGGSIFLHARDTVDPAPQEDNDDLDDDQNSLERVLRPTRTGALTLGAGSVTEVLPQTDDPEETVDAQAFTASRISLQGRTVDIFGSLRAPAGKVTVSAVANPRVLERAVRGLLYDPVHANPSDPARRVHTRIYIGSAARIDVAGLRDVPLPMEDHQLEVRLFSEQLKDAPLLRGGALFGQTVYLDARTGTPLFDISAAVALNRRGVAERSTAGGSIDLRSEGTVVVREGALLDVSGGSLAYAAGVIRTSQLVHQGRLTEISQARPDVAYESLADVYAVTDPKWGVTRTWNLGQGVAGTFHAAYTQGRDAGSISVWAPDGLALHGTLRADTVVGERQRQARPLGGGFSLGNTLIAGFLAPDQVYVTEMLASLPSGYKPGEILPAEVANRLRAGMLTGFERIELAAKDDLEVNAAMQVTTPGGQMTRRIRDQEVEEWRGRINLLAGQRMEVRADMAVAGGEISLAAKTLNVAPQVTLSAAGRWSDDLAGVTLSPVVLDGGSMILSGNLTLGEGSRVDVSAGAWRRANASLVFGKAGGITLSGESLALGGSLSGYGWREGGSLSITVQQDVQIGGARPGGNTFWLPEGFFQQGGFAAYSVASSKLNGRFVVGDPAHGSVIQARAAVYQMPSQAPVSAAGGAPSLRGLVEVAWLPEHLEQAVSLSLSASHTDQIIGSLRVTPNTRVHTTAGGSISLAAGDWLEVQGSLIAPGGRISLSLADDNSAYDDSRAIWLGAHARLLATGHFRATPDNGSGVLRGSLLASRGIDIRARKGYVVLESGALLDTSGVAAVVDVLTGTTHVRTRLASHGGNIALHAREGLLLDATLRAHGVGPGAAGGHLGLGLTGGRPDAADNPRLLPLGARVLTLVQTHAPVTAGLAPGDDLSSGVLGNGQGRIGVDQVRAGGFAGLGLTSFLSASGGTHSGGDRIAVAAGVDLTGLARLSLNTPLLALTGSGSAHLDARHVTWYNDASKVVALVRSGELQTTPGNTLNLNAGWLDLEGFLAFSGAERLHLSADLDIRALGGTISGAGFEPRSGHLLAPRDLHLRARQIYPASVTTFELHARNIHLTRSRHADGSAVAHTPVYSAGGGLTLVADTIHHHGVLKAPLGSLGLEAGTINLGAESVTAVSTGGLIVPFGHSRQSGREWIDLNAPPRGMLSLKAANIEQAPGAVIDLSGGGDLMAREFVSGIYGTRDILAQAGVFAILPGEHNGFSSAVTDHTLGEAINLSDGEGLPAGTYTLLPAHYALLPGAWLVQSRSGTTDMTPAHNHTLADGSQVRSGLRLNRVSGAVDSRRSGFVLTPGQVFDLVPGQVYKGPAEYVRSHANTFFASQAARQGVAAPLLPRDAGQLVLDASASLNLRGQIVTRPGAGGLGGRVDIVASRIRVVTQTGAPDGSLQLEAGMLSALNLSSLLLGGTRDLSGGVTQLTAGTDHLSVEQGASLAANELLLLARDTLEVHEQAALRALGGAAGAPGSVQLTGDSAFMRLSGLSDATILRRNASAHPTRGNLVIRAGAVLQAGRALALDASRDFVNAGNYVLGQGASVYLGARRIGLGRPAGAVGGLVLDDAQFAALGQAASLTLSSGGTLDLYGALDFGHANLALTVQAAGLAGYDNAGATATLRASSLTLSNPNALAFGTPAGLGSGSLRLEAGRIAFGSTAGGAAASQDLAIRGFDAVLLRTPGEVLGLANGTLSITAAEVQIESARLGLASGVQQQIAATGLLALRQSAQPASLPASLGGRLTLSGRDVLLAGRVHLPAGEIRVQAVGTGAGQGNITLAAGAELLAASGMSVFDGLAYTTTGGTVRLTATGDVVLEQGARVDVSGIDHDGGLLHVQADRNLVLAPGNLAGSLTGGAGADALGARLVLDVAQVRGAAAGNDFSALSHLLRAGGFGGEIDLRLRQGDVVVAAGDTLTAQRISLTADGAGSRLTVHGTLDASGAQAGEIALHAQGDLVVGAGARLAARAHGAGEAGGTVLLASRSGWIDLAGGSGIDLAGGSGSAGGTLHLRAARNAANADLNVRPLAGTVTGARRIRLEGVDRIADASLTTADVGTTGAAYTRARSFMQHLPTIRDRLGVNADDARFELVPGVEIVGTGDIALANDWNLAAWRYDRGSGAVVTDAGQLAAGSNANGDLLAGVLTLRAGGHLNLNANLSDGFSTATSAGVAQGRDAWSLRLVAGADLDSANPLTLLRAVAAGAGNLTLAENRLVRTGTGRIDLAAAGNLTLANHAAAIYTAGRIAEPLDGFTPTTADLTAANRPLYLTDGGDLNIRVRGNITAALPPPPLNADHAGTQQVVNNWLFRQVGGSRNRDLTWWVRPNHFRQGVATLGGGDVYIEAGGNISHMVVAAATSGRVPNRNPDQLRVTGGGDVRVRAGGDILSGVYHLGRGAGRLYAAGRIDDADARHDEQNNTAMGAMLSVQDGRFRVQAGADAFIQAIINPTLWAQATPNIGNAQDRTGRLSFFSSYTATSGMRLASLHGQAVYGSPSTKTVSHKVAGGLNFDSSGTAPLGMQPPQVDLVAHRGDVSTTGMGLWPGQAGRVNLLADGNVEFRAAAKDGVYVSDADATLLPSMANPVRTPGDGSALREGRALTPVHAGQNTVSRIVARRGDITGPAANLFTLRTPHALRMRAGGDIQRLDIDIQHVNAHDLSLVQAGRDLRMPKEAMLRVHGAGELLALAGRDIDLGDSHGIVSAANTVNPVLDGARGANLTLIAGLGGDGAGLFDAVAGYVARYLDPRGPGPAALAHDAAGRAAYRDAVATAVGEHMRGLTGQPQMDAAQAMQAFLALDAERQAVFVARHLWRELDAAADAFFASGNEADYARGYAAIDALFPGADGAASPYAGNIDLFRSRVRTLRNASIDLLAPGGMINVGLPGAAAGGGLVTELGGPIRAVADAGFLVNQSRVITQYASDISVWVSNGDIDAGRGSQTALSVSDKLINVDQHGFVSVEFKGAAAGSGIRAQTYDLDGPLGPLPEPPLRDVRVTLLAPRGVLNASEAGIAAGQLRVIAREVLGTDNIQVEGTATGVVLDAASIAPPPPPDLSAAGQASEEATRALAANTAAAERQQQAMREALAGFRPTFISVEVLGFGGAAPRNDTERRS